MKEGLRGESKGDSKARREGGRREREDEKEEEERTGKKGRREREEKERRIREVDAQIVFGEPGMH